MRSALCRCSSGVRTGYPGTWRVVLCVLAVVFAFRLSDAMAVPADPNPREVTQPDGTTFQLRLRGDEYFSWHETVEGYTVAKDSADGFWKYAQPATDRVAFIVIPDARVGSCDPASLGLGKHARPDAKLLKEIIEERQRELMGEPEELPVPDGVTETDLKTGVRP